jgi:uncharacterized protein
MKVGTDRQYSRRGALALGGAAVGGMLLGPPAAAASPPGSSIRTGDGVALRRVSFQVPQVGRLVGHLRVPSRAAGRAPAVVISNPFTAAKDQSVVTGYAQGLAAAGFVTLAFDQRNFGDSDGLPRLHEDLEERLLDLQAAVSYLVSQDRLVDADRIGVLGVSIGGGLAMRLTAFDPRVKAFVAIAAGLHDPALFRQLFTPEGYAAALQDMAEQAQRYHRTGEPEYQPVVTADGGGALLPSPEAFRYYGTERAASKIWQNRATRLSLRTLLIHDVRNPADLVGPRAGMLAVGSDDTATPVELHQQIYDRLTGPRELFIVDGAGHNDLYDQPQFVGQVTERAARFLREHLH